MRHRMERLLTVGTIAGALATSAPADAQDFSGPLSPGAFETTLNMGPIANTLRMQSQRITPRRQPPAAPKAVPVSTRYVPSRARRDAYLAGFVAQARRRDPQGADQLAVLFAQGDIIDRTAAELRRYGARTDDVADVYAIWWVNLWLASRGDASDPSPRAIAAVRRQAADALAVTGVLRGASDADKQQLAESMLLQTVLVAASLEQAKADAALMRRVQALARDGASARGLDLRTMTLTEDGFRPA